MTVEHLFVDTNILVYANDADAGEKHNTLVKKVASLWERPYPPSISTQVIQELYVTLARKGASTKECQKIVNIYLDWEVIGHDIKLVQSAMVLNERFKLSLWDSLIIAAAQRAKAKVLWSEDLQNGQRFDELVVVNPIE